ncbi:MAG: hypothetical protein JST26_04570 [Bacteroidetes bacterium]|nr:hypothetical protein [Bacteroidota bacterium]
MTQWTSIFLTSLFLLFGQLCSGQIDSLYSIALNKADSAYAFKSWGSQDKPSDKIRFEEAKKLYTIALEIKPKETYPESRIKEIEKILYNFKTRPIYNKLISKADSLFLAGNFLTAKTYYLKADSLYTNERTKETLSAIYALTDATQNSSGDILFIKHGTSFGECSGYCFHETKYTQDLIIHTGKSWNKDPDKIDTLKMEMNIWKNMVNAIDVKAFYMLPHTMGCPDCTDGGAEWLIIGTKNTEWQVEFNYGSDTETTKKLLNLVRQPK